MGKVFVTISREYGSAGHKIGEILSNHLSVPYYDNELLLLAAEHGDIDVNKFAKFDEKKMNQFLYECNYSGNDNVVKGMSMENTLFDLQEQVIINLAKEKDGAIFVGRCADYILREAGYKVLSIFVTAPLEQRVERTMGLQGMNQAQVEAITKKKDKNRKKYYEYHTGHKWGDPQTYDMWIDTSKVTINDAVDQIEEEYRKLKAE